MTSLVVTMLGLVAAHLGRARSDVADLGVPAALAVGLAHPPARDVALGVAMVIAALAGGRALYQMQAARRLMDADPEAAPTQHGNIIIRRHRRQWAVDLNEQLRRVDSIRVTVMDSAATAPPMPRSGRHDGTIAG